MTAWQPQQAPRPKNQAKIAVVAVGALVVLAGVAAAAVTFGSDLLGTDSSDTTAVTGSTLPPGAEGDVLAALAEFTDALSRRDLISVSVAGTTTSAAVQADYEKLVDGLGEFTVEPVGGAVSFPNGDRATVAVETTWTFPDDVVWVSTGTATLEQEAGEWLVEWSPALLEASLGSGDQLRVDSVTPSRAPIVARDGTVLIGNVDQVQIGVQPARVQDLPSLVADLERLVGADPADVTARVNSAAPDDFVPVTTLSRGDYDAIRDEIFPLPGTVFKETSEPAANDPDLARALLGRSGEVTAEILEADPGLYQPGDIVGLSGLQKAYNEQLAGRPGMEVEVVRAVPEPGSSSTTGTGLTTTSAVRRQNESEVLFASDMVDGEAVILTIDPVFQRAAEQALANEARPSSMVAIQVSTGQVLAVANGPTGSTVNFAMTGQYSPGSIFKVVTGYTVVRDRLRANDPIDCPQNIQVGGRTFGNAEDEVLGRVSFLSAFAHSCNTAFVGATLGYDLDTLNEAGAQFGLGVDYQLGADVFSGSVPVNDDNVDLAAAAFGQGRLLVSPFSAAVMTATAAGGTYRSPVLITSGEPPAQVVEPLEPEAAATLRDMMRAVVTEGTGRIMNRVPGPPVSGKTGTAEFGNAVPPRTHAWFVGYQGDIAFAVLVEDGGFGGSVAAPLAAQFLTSVAGIEPAGGGTAPGPAPSGQDDGGQEDGGQGGGNGGGGG